MTASTGEGTSPAARAPRTVRRGEPDFPVPPEDIARAGGAAPDHWLSVTDRHWIGDTDDEPPPVWAVLGRWRSDAHGEIVEWEENPDYRPSPAALGWAPPVSDADAAAQLAATGYGPPEAVADALLDAGEVAVCVGEDGRPVLTETPEGTRAVSVFTASPRLDADRLPPHVMMPVPELLDQVPRERDLVFLSSSAPVALLVPVDGLRASGDGAARGTSSHG